MEESETECHNYRIDEDGGVAGAEQVKLVLGQVSGGGKDGQVLLGVHSHNLLISGLTRLRK